MGGGEIETPRWERGPNGSKRSTWVEMDQRGEGGRGVPGRREEGRSEKMGGKGDGLKNHLSGARGAFLAPAHPDPHMGLLDTPSFRAPTPPHSPLLQELEGSREASTRDNRRRVMVRGGQGRAPPRDRSPLGASSPLIHLGGGLQGLPEEGRQERQQWGRDREEPDARSSP